jgi:Cof subfamily protein (haloacid dehalogenase superfamily)
MISLAFIDVDGTLVGSSGMVPAAVWAAIDRTRNGGIHLALCSGRPAFGIARDLAARLDPTGWHVFQNGASIVHLPSGQSKSAGIAEETIKRLVEQARRTGRVLELYTDTEYAVESTGEQARQHAALLGVPFQPRSFDSLRGTIVRAQWLLLPDQVDAALAEPHPGLELSASGSPVMPGTTFANMTPAGITKASAVRTVAMTYDIALLDVMVVGDGHNDMAAMQAVGLPIAMGNADPAVQAVARRTVGHVDDGGLVEALDLTLQSRRSGKLPDRTVSRA